MVHLAWLPGGGALLRSHPPAAQLGESWDPEAPRCDTRRASLGAAQLAWLERQLASGQPALVFLHYPLPGEPAALPSRDRASSAR